MQLNILHWFYYPLVLPLLYTSVQIYKLVLKLQIFNFLIKYTHISWARPVKKNND